MSSARTLRLRSQLLTSDGLGTAEHLALVRLREHGGESAGGGVLLEALGRAGVELHDGNLLAPHGPQLIRVVRFQWPARPKPCDSCPLILGTCVGALIALVAVRLGSRTQGASNQVQPTTDLAPTRSDAPAPSGEGEVIVVPDPVDDVAIVLGEPGSLDWIGERAAQSVSDRPSPFPGAVRTAIQAGGLATGGKAKLDAARGMYVKLDPSSVAERRKFGPVKDATGKTLGIVRGDKNIRHVVRFQQGGANALAASNLMVLAATAAIRSS